MMVSKKGGTALNIDELSASCAIPVKTLQEYASYGVLVNDREAVSRENIRRLGVADTLHKAGLSMEAIGRFFQQQGRTIKISMLREKRRQILTVIHEQQRLLEQLDGLIWEEQKGASQ